MKRISCFSLAVAILFCSTFSACKEDNNSLSNTPIINPSGDDIIDGIGYDGEFIVGYHDIDWEQMQSDMKIPNDSNDMELRSATIATIAIWFGSQFAAFVANKSFDFVYNELFNDEPEEENISARFDAIDAKLEDISIAIKALGRQNELGELSVIVNNHNNITNQFGNVSNIWKSVDECDDDSAKVANVINSWWNSYNIDLGKISQYFGILKENTVQGKKYHYFEIIDNLILYSNAWEHNSFVSRRCFRASETVFACQLASLTLLKLLIDNNAL